MFSDATHRVGAQFRSQWSSVASDPYTTTTLAFDMPVKERWGIGGYILNDDLPRVLNVFSAAVTGAYQIMDPEQQDHWLSVGLRAGMIQKSIQQDELLFDRQYTEGHFDPNLAHGEDLTTERKFLPEVGVGVRYRMEQEEKMLNPYAGVAVYHITSPDESFTGEKSRLPRRYVLHGGTRISITEDFSIDPGFRGMMQGEALEINGGMDLQYRFDEEKPVAAHLGGYYRFGDAFILMAGIDYEQLLFRMSYDLNTSPLSAYSQGRGAWEFSLVYKLEKGIRK